MHPIAKNYPFTHKPYTLCVLCVLRGEFLQWTQQYLLKEEQNGLSKAQVVDAALSYSPLQPILLLNA